MRNNILKSDAGIVANANTSEKVMKDSGRVLVDGVWTKSIITLESKEYTVQPNRKPDMLKAKYKASKANKYIGYGKKDSSTELYANQLISQGMPINTGEYNKNDIVFVSVNGTPSRENYTNTLKQAIAALEAGATLLTDSKEYLEKSIYNKGEQQLAKNLLARGYIRNTAKDQKDVGVWVKPVIAKVEEVAKQEDGTMTANKLIEQNIITPSEVFVKNINNKIKCKD